MSPIVSPIHCSMLRVLMHKNGDTWYSVNSTGNDTQIYSDICKEVRSGLFSISIVTSFICNSTHIVSIVIFICMSPQKIYNIQKS